VLGRVVVQADRRQVQARVKAPAKGVVADRMVEDQWVEDQVVEDLAALMPQAVAQAASALQAQVRTLARPQAQDNEFAGRGVLRRCAELLRDRAQQRGKFNECVDDHFGRRIEFFDRPTVVVSAAHHDARN